MKKLLITMLLLCVYYSYAQTTTVNMPTVGSTANFTVPAGVTQITVECWGGGGRGGSRSSTNGSSGGGGGGAYSRTVYNVTPGQVIPYFVGAGSTADNVNGGNSWFFNDTTQFAEGGKTVGMNNSNGASGGAVAVGQVVYYGGNGSNALASAGGGGGSSAGTSANGNSTVDSSTSALAPSGGGRGGNGATSGANGSVGTVPGGGGGGARRTSSTNRNGGAGADGRIYITYSTVFDLTVSGNSIVIADGDVTPSMADHTDFGNVAVTGSFIRTFTITNTSPLNIITIGSFTISGTNAGDFSVVSLPASSLAAGATTTFQVQFNPLALGARSATISFDNNSSTGKNPYNFSLSGTGSTIPEPSHTIYYEDFTTGAGGWSSSTQASRNGSWVRTNVPEFGMGHYFATNTTASFTRNSGMYLTSPTFDFTGFVDIRFSLDIRLNLPDTGDGVRVEYSINNGTWTILDSPVTHDFWYNQSSISGLSNTRGWTNVLTGNASSPSKFHEGSVSSKIFDNQSNVRFRIYFSDDNDTSVTGIVAVDNIVVRGNPINNVDPVSGPAGVNSNLKLWLNSISGLSLNNGDFVSLWGDQAKDNHAYGHGSSRPVYFNNSTNNINYNPVISFTRSNQQYLTGKGGFWSNDYYIVVKTKMTADLSYDNTLMPIAGKFTKDAQGQDPTGLSLGRISGRFGLHGLVNHTFSTFQSGSTGVPGPNSYGRAFSSNSTFDTGLYIINVKANTSVTPNINEIYINGKRVDNLTARSGNGTDLIYASFSNLIYHLSVCHCTLNGDNIDTFLDGDLTEVLSYSTQLTNTNQQKVYSYLALKNGISLKNPSSSLSFTSNQADWNYVDSNNTVIWDVAANAGYNFDVAGIGRDDNGSLVQKQSKSTNNNTVVTIGIGDVMPVNSQNTNNFTGDRQFLVWGSNNQNMNNSGSPLNINLGPMTVTTVTDVVNRKWKIVETGGDVGVVKVSVPVSAFTSGLPALGPTDAYVMVVANDPNFTTAVETVFMQTEGANQTCRYDFDGVRYFSFGVAHRVVASNHLTFDGNDDFVRIDKVNPLNSQFNIMAWVNLNGANDAGTNRMIVSKANSTNGYEFYITTDNRVRMQWTNGATTHGVTSSVALPNNVWHHVCANYNGSTLTLYIDGVAAGSSNIGSAPVDVDSYFSIGSKYIDKNNILNLFKGNIEELRLFNKALSLNEIRFIMNQEIEQHGTNIRGKIIPTSISKNDILDLNWNHLQAHYTMNSYIGTHLDDDSQFTNRGSLIIPDKVSINPQTAPLPYITTANGSWDSASTWSNGNQMYVPFGLSIVDNSPIAWNIIRVGHNINSTGNKEVLSLFLDNGTYTVENDSKIQVSHYLLLNGKIDLVGRSQLVQDVNSDLAVTSTGSIERDQQGQRNRFNYNYWSSPVSTINSTTINHGFRVSQVMRDGTNPNNPLPFNWTNGVNGSSTSPITLSSYWIFKFVNTSNNIANWVQVGHNGLLNTGEGFTMKGHGNVDTGTQNYVFQGKPNNGSISRPVSANNLLLTGNPYPSAIDAEKFIDDNISSITGALYFWEHYSTNNTHNLGGYQGGYATLTKVGATPPIAPAMISGMGSSDKVAGRYIPVGQGFFVVGNATGGNVSFNNDQRLFIKEDHALSNTMFKSSNDKQTTSTVSHENNNNNDPVAPKLRRPKIRIGMNSFNGHHRQILIGFMGNEADDSYNPGYDGYHIDNQQSEMYFVIPNGTAKLNVQGVGAFQLNAIYPIGFKAGGNGTYQFTLDGTEDFPENIPIYIYDNVTNIYHNIKDGIANVTLTTGEYLNRFDLRFQNETLGNPDFDLLSTAKLFYTQNNHSLNLVNPMSLEFDSLKVFNILGQEVQSSKIQDASNHVIIPVNNLPSGTYLVKVKGTQGEIQTKFIIP